MEKINKIKKESTDEEIIEFMKNSETVGDWNARRSLVKKIRSTSWITINLDASKLINKSKIK